MDYQKFYNEVVAWIAEVNNKAVQYGLSSNQFWDWVMQSVGQFEIRYNNNELVIKQMVMLVEWLMDMEKRSRGGA